jgi:hypothetical protein
MRKSILYFFLLAIVSFIHATTKSNKQFAIYYDIWGIHDNIGTNPSYGDIMVCSRVSLANQFSNPFDFDGPGGNSVTNYYSQLNYAYESQVMDNEPFVSFDATSPAKNVTCPSPTSQTCLAYTSTNNLGPDAVLSVKLGTYTVVDE